MRSALQLMWAGGIFIPPEILTRGAVKAVADLGVLERVYARLRRAIDGR
jgi:hypothetical protein